MHRIIKVLLFAALLGLLVGLVGACESADRTAMLRAQSEAALEAARADAYARTVQADVMASAEREAQRQNALEAAHQRRVDSLPVVLSVGAAGLIMMLLAVAVVLKVVYARPAGGDDRLLLAVSELARLQADRDRELWRAVALLDRRVAPTERGEVPMLKG